MLRLLTLSFVLAGMLPGQSPTPIDKHELRSRRETLAARIAESHPGQRCLVVLRGCPKQADMGAFVQHQDFFYLTGVAEPDVAMLLVTTADGELAHDELLVPPFSPFSAKWDGRFLAPGDASAERTGFATVGNVRSLHRRLREMASTDGDVPWIVVTKQRPPARFGSTPRKANDAAEERERDVFDGRLDHARTGNRELARIMPNDRQVALEDFVHAMRPHKSAAELALIRRSTQIAAAGIGEAMKSCAPGVFEYQLSAVARCVFSLHGCGPDAYAAIVGGGPNGCILHYNACDRRLRDDDLIVMDYAATLHGYCSDVTRTFPASGRFTPEQRKLVEDVHQVQKLLLAEVKPGASLGRLGMMCAKLLVERGYRNDHGPCHHVGLAVHDPSVDELAAGMVITVEPGAYLPERGYGCRIEDCVLVTDDGCEVLSKDVPSHPDEIEKWMQQEPRIPIR